MEAIAEKKQEDKSRFESKEVFQLANKGHGVQPFADNPSDSDWQGKLQATANSSPRVQQLRAFQETANKGQNARKAAQLKSLVNNDASRSGLVQKKENANFGTEPVQRSVLVGGEFWVTDEDLEDSPLNNEQTLGEILESIQGLDNLPDAPTTIQEAINDVRTFYLFRNGEYYESDVTNYIQPQGEPVDRHHLEVNTAPDIVIRGEVPQTLRISGLISCVAVIAEAGNDEGTQILIGMHYTTGYHTGDNEALNARGTDALQGMQVLADGYNITRVHLCYQLQLNRIPQPATVTNLQNLRAFFGEGICQTYPLNQNHVTARLDPDGTVAIGV